MRLSKKDYVARIVNADPLQLTIIAYELVLDHIGQAKDCIQDPTLFQDHLKKAHLFLRELQDTLDLQYELSKNLFHIYVYVNKLLTQAQFGGGLIPLEEAQSLLETLLDGWRELEKTNTDKAPVMENTQQVFAGLTYHKGQLSEMIIEGAGRGYQA